MNGEGMPRLAILCPGFAWMPRGIESVVNELSIRLCCRWAVDIYTLAPAAVSEASNMRLLHVHALPRSSLGARGYASLGHRFMPSFKLRSPVDFEALTFSLGMLPTLMRRHYAVVINFAGPFAGYACKLKRHRDGTPFVHAAQGQSIGWLELMHADQTPDYYFALSQPAYEWIQRVRPGMRSALVPNGVNTNRFAPGTAPVPIDLPRPIYLFVGALTSVKRVELLYDALAQLRTGSLLLVGDGEDREHYLQLGESTLGKDRFRHIPFIPQESLPSYYAASDVFTMPSRDEAFGVVFLEALACNKPVVAHNGPVQHWIVGEGGVVCNCENASEYSGALQLAATTNWGNRPRTRALAFSWDAVADLYHKYLSELVGNREHSSSGTQ